MRKKVFKPRIRSVRFSGSELKMSVQFPGSDVVKVLAEGLAECFDGVGATNPVEVRAREEKGKQRTFVVTIQLETRPTPHEIVAAFRPVLEAIANTNPQAAEALKFAGYRK